MGFQKQVYIEPALGVAGDFASANPRATVLAGPGALVADTAGVTVGRFAWADANGKVTNAGTGVPSGFVHREQQGVITIWLGEATMLIPAGLGVTLHDGGDFLAATKTVATIGQKVFASNTDGTVSTGAAGDTIAGHTETAWKVASAGAIGALIKMTSYTLG
ncbi:structural cement protein Gp24 [Achromobacter xylosoxidans]